MESARLPEHPNAQEEYLHLRRTRDTIDREIRDVEALTGARAGEELTDPVFGRQAELKQLTVSYRNTVEIMEMARAVSEKHPIPGISETKPVLRHGEPPKILRAQSDAERQAMMVSQVHAWLQEGFHSIALIEKTEARARKLFRAIGAETNARLLSESDSDYRGGVIILPASIAKGMEFDCVGICDASAENFPDNEFLCRILYVMMTRPLHRLCVWYQKDPSPLLEPGGGVC